jgi:hypothetical protein
MTTTVLSPIDALYKVRKGTVAFVDVPELALVAVEGASAPGGQEFQQALHALYSVSYGAHFALRKATGAAPRVMPLEALWWIDGADEADFARRAARGDRGGPIVGDGEAVRWKALIVQRDPLDAAIVEQAIRDAKAKTDDTTLDRVRFECWTEGPCAQVLHVGPYAAEAATIAMLHEAIAARGWCVRGRHHEIYLGDPRRSAPEKLRTILRQPVTPGG